MVDPDFGIDEVVEMVIEAKQLSNSKKEFDELIETFKQNFKNDYLIIKKDNWDANWKSWKNKIRNRVS